MKKATKIINSGSKDTFSKLKFKSSITPDYDEYKKVVKAINEFRCQDIVESEEGHILPSNIGRLVILINKPRVSQVYSTSRPGTKIYNLHSFGWIARVYHKENILLRYPKLFRFRPHRANIKVPIYNHMMSSSKSYFKHSDYIG